MAYLILRAFGGMAPSANAKAIDPAVATYAQNLNQRFSDFRPLPGALVVGAAAAGATLYRFETSGDFITRAGTVHFVRGPIPTDATERTYYTGDGLPAVIDNTGDVRRLGVPAPVAAPAVTVNVTDEYSQDDEAAAKAAALSNFTGIIWDNCDWPYVGLSDADLADRFIPGGAPWVYSLTIPGTMVDGQFTPTNKAHRNLIDDRLRFHIGPYQGGTAGWVDMHVRGAEVVLNPTLKADLMAIADPSDATGVRKLIAEKDADTIIASLTNDLKAPQLVRDASVARLRALKTEFLTVADTSSAVPDSLRAAITEFYQRPDVAAEVDKAINSAAAAIRSALRTYSNPIDNPYIHLV